MKQFLSTIALVFALSSCEIDFSGNGALDGYWQMTAVDTLSTGGNRDMFGSKVYWAVQRDLLEAKRFYEFGVLFKFQHSDGVLTLSDPYINDRDSSDIKVSDVSMVQPMGINALEESFSIVKLDRNAMTLQSSVLRLHFRRY